MTFTLMSDCRAKGDPRRPQFSGPKWPLLSSLSTTIPFNAGCSRRWPGDSVTRRRPPNRARRRLARLEAADRPPVDLVILDLVMPDLDGMGVLARMRQREIAIPAIVQTAHGSIEAVISAMRAGALDFVVKPVGAERLQVSIKNALRVDALEDELRRANAPQRRRADLPRHRQQGRETWRAVIRLAERAAKSNIPVLIEGESGVGKELHGARHPGRLGAARQARSSPSIAARCRRIWSNSILFGHEKGAFTGATEKHVGKFVEANGGTLFLDEIGELPPDAQVKLLRALQEGEIDPVGARRPVKVDFRLVSATNQNLIELVKRGRFREDLFYRLNVFPIAIPPLRARAADIPDLARRFLARFSAEEGKRIRGIARRRLRTARRLRLAGQRAPARKRGVPRRGARRRRRVDASPSSRRSPRRSKASTCAFRRRRRPAPKARPTSPRTWRRRASTRAIPISCG